MKSFLMVAAVAGMLTGAAGIASADQHIKQRKENQQARIANGVANGSLTPRETAHLEHREARLNHEIRTERRENGGNLTNNEKAQVNRQQNSISRDIYRQKHDAQHQ